MIVFNEEQLKQIEILASKGLSLKQIADYLGLSYSSFANINQRDMNIGKYYRKGKMKTGMKVTNILFGKIDGTFKPSKY